MIERYNIEEIRKLWGDSAKFKTWWLVEKLTIAGLCKAGIIPGSDNDLIQHWPIKVSSLRVHWWENRTQHETVAFTKSIVEQINDPAKKWIHFGLTSSDVIDTAQNYTIQQANQVVIKDIKSLSQMLRKTALKYKDQLIMGRTHGMHAEPTSLGLKFLLWFKELDRWSKNFKSVRHIIEVTKISGSVGNYAHIDPSVQIYVAEHMGMQCDWSNNQVTQRDRHIALFNSFASLAATLEKIALEFRHWQRTEIDEISEGYDETLQKGSSSMPHKKNPISGENICGLARLICSYPVVAYQNNVLWQERDISHSSNERIILPQVYHLTTYLLRRVTRLIRNMVVNPEQIKKNINLSHNIFYSQVILSYIIAHTNHSRDEIYDFIQCCAFVTQKKRLDFLTVLEEKGIDRFITVDQLHKICNLSYFNRHVDFIFTKNKL